MLSRRSAVLLTLVFFGSSLLAAETLTVEGDPGGPLRGSAPKTITLQLSPEAARALRKLPDKAGEGPSVRLAIQGVKAPAGTSIHVFVNSPDASGTTPTNDLHYVGNITSFEEPAADGPGDDVLFDAGPALRHLKKSERVLAGDTLGVTLAVAQGSAPEDASIAVEKVVLSIASQGR